MTEGALDTRQFDFPLPEELIAQEPVPERDDARLFVVDRKTGEVGHRRFREIVDLLPRNAGLFRNNASVLPARLHGFRPTGGAVECLLLGPGAEPGQWRCLLKPGKKLPPGTAFGIDGEYRAEVVRPLDRGERLVAFSLERDASVPELANRLGEIPLPPYIRRQRDDPRKVMDRERYETVYADPGRRVAAAAPTAGLHFTPDLLQALAQRGLHAWEITLHVGAGTFQPIKTDRIAEHRIHREFYEIPEATRRILDAEAPGPRVAIGTTTVRTLEDYARRRHTSPPAPGGNYAVEADLFLYPPARFELTDIMVTNFHLPRSTLLCLVAAFLSPGDTRGVAWLKQLYAEAVARRYRFYSYGDAMLIL